MTKNERERRAQARLSTIKRLFARSCNKCAFPGCNAPIIDAESDAMVGEMCHIEGVGKTALRHNKALTREERDAYPNLILLCSNHHAIIDHDEQRFTVPVLKQMKANHEAQGNLEILPRDSRYAEICIATIDSRRTTRTSSRTYTNSVHIEAPGGVVNFTGPTPAKMTAPPDSIQNDAKKRAYVNRLRQICIDTDLYHKDKKAAASILNKAIIKQFGTTALLVSTRDFSSLCEFIKRKIDASIPGRKSLKERHCHLYESFVE